MCGMSTPVTGRDMPATSEDSVHDPGSQDVNGGTVVSDAFVGSSISIKQNEY